MKIRILREDNWANSFKLDDGSLLKSNSKLGVYKKFDESKIKISKDDSHQDILKKIKQIYPNFTYQTVTKSTVNGILSRLCGEMRPMSDIKDNFILNIQDKVHFTNAVDSYVNDIKMLMSDNSVNDSGAQHDGPVIRNDSFLRKNAFTNMIYSSFNIDINDVVKLEEYEKNVLAGDFNSIEGYYGDISTYILLDKIEKGYGKFIVNIIHSLNKHSLFSEELNSLKKKDGSFMCFLGLSGEKLNITPKNFYSFFTNKLPTVKKYPYSIELNSTIFDDEAKKKYKTNAILGIIKESGILEITIDLNEEEEKEFIRLMEQASVGTFTVGKKGIAYIDSIECNHVEYVYR